MRSPRLALLASGVLWLCACGGGSPEEGQGGAGGATVSSTGASTGSGAGPYALGSLDEPCGPSGLTAQGVLDMTEPTYSTLFAYIDGGTSVGLLLGVAYDAGVLTCHPPFSTGQTGPDVSEQVEVEVDFSFETEDGAFAEHFAAPLIGGIGPLAVLSKALPADQIQGTFDPNLPELTDVGVGFEAQFDHATTSGSVTKGGKKSGNVGESQTVGTWHLMP